MVHPFGTQNLPLFVLSGLLLNMTPGQDTLYIVGRSVAQGKRAGMLSVLGIVAGCCVHTLAAAFGLSAILAASSRAFLAVKLCGAAYLVYLGIGMVLDRGTTGQIAGDLPSDRSWEIVRSGFLTNVLNPKVALFFLAFLPQFIDPAAQSKIAAFLFLGFVFMFNGSLWCLVLVFAAAAISRRLRTNRATGRLATKAAGVLFVGLGLKMAISR